MELKEIKLTPRRIELLEKMGITSVEQLVHTYPFRYETIVATPFDQWQVGNNVAFEGVISSGAYVVRLGRKRSMTRFKVIFDEEEIEVTLFNRPWTQQFVAGKTITIFGQVQGRNKVTASNYNFNPLSSQEGMKPVYSLTQGLKQNEMIQMVQKGLDAIKGVQSVVPERYKEKYRLLDSYQALRMIHKPMDPNELTSAIRTLKYEEFLQFQCVMQASQKTEEYKEAKVFSDQQIQDFIHQFEYELTPDQLTSIQAVCDDMRSSKIMFRLVQGDVGCGKTIVAMTALYASQCAGYQSALLAPTEILARQHYENMKAMGLDARLYVSAISAKEKREILEGLQDGSIQMVVGTHALFQEAVTFSNLGLVIADEQQRFGVRQRRSLLEKGKNVDFLMMSATPIPRTYAHFIYGNMEISNIHTLPKGRKPVITKFVESNSMKPILKDVLDGIEQGRQCYVVTPAIEDNEDTTLRSAQSIYEGMQQTFKNKLRVGILHGKMTSDEKEEVMNHFAAGEIDILVSTTVIEVGIDVKNATLMVIYDAHRFGLSTLHQLRGRVARGQQQGYCYLMSSTQDPQAKQRLKKLETVTDGFAITELDLQTRGPGDILGIRQSGLPNFVLGDLNKDKAMMEACIEDAKEILERNEDAKILTVVKEAIEKAEYFD